MRQVAGAGAAARGRGKRAGQEESSAARHLQAVLASANLARSPANFHSHPTAVATAAPHHCRRNADAERRQLQGAIEGLQRDVSALHRDVAGRDDAIADKERRILELKHKTQVSSRC